jgi:hypothetical protein
MTRRSFDLGRARHAHPSNAALLEELQMENTSHSRGWITPLLALLLIAPLLAPNFGTTAYAKSSWEVIAQESGVVVSRKYIESYDLPIIKGVGTINANIYHVLAVLDDIDRNKEWMHSTKETKLLRLVNENERILYNRTSVPWPASDRDAVMHATIKPDFDKKRVTIAFKNIKSSLMKEVDGVVRMPIVRGFYLLEKVSAERTRITYQAEADVGGFIPDWLVEMNSKEIPLKTILSLRKQVRKTKGQYNGFMKKWDPRLGGKGF